MATWKRLKRTTEGELDVNMDLVVHMEWSKDRTIIYFAVPSSEHVHTLMVRETPDEIHAKGGPPPLRLKGAKRSKRS